MKKREKLFNYTLSIAFILLIVIFLTSIIQISRYVLSDGNALQEHVVSTKTLLEDIEKVEQSVEQNQGNQEIKAKITEKEKISNYDKHISEIGFYNINSSKSILTLKLDAPIQKLNDFYYIEYKSLDTLEKSDIIIYGAQKTGVILGVETEDKSTDIKIYDYDLKDTINIEFEDILGKIIYEKD